jgi:histidine triad (HIT) family protein
VRDPTCTFCGIIARENPAHILDENDQVIVFLSLSNHPMVVTKAHIADIYTMPDDLGAAVMQATIKVARTVKQALQCDGVYLTQANEHAAGQDVFHYHLHVYPCWGNSVKNAVIDFVNSVIDPKDLTEDRRAATAVKIRQELASF